MANEVRLIECRSCDCKNCNGCNLFTLAEMLHNRDFDCLMDEHKSIAFTPESLRPKGRWEIHCRSTYDSWTQETDEEFYLECSECKRQVWDVDYMAAQNDDRQKLIEKYPYCHCGCKMEG